MILGQALVGAGFVVSRRRLLGPLLQYPTQDERVDWRTEIWPFQWRLAVSWLCGYFTFQLFNPILFAVRGPIEAGQMGDTAPKMPRAEAQALMQTVATMAQDDAALAAALAHYADLLPQADANEAQRAPDAASLPAANASADWFQTVRGPLLSDADVWALGL